MGELQVGLTAGRVKNGWRLLVCDKADSEHIKYGQNDGGL